MAKENNFVKEINKHIGFKIYELRISSGLARAKLAKEINVTQQQLQKYEQGINNISIGRLILLSKIFNKNIEYFFQDFTEKNTKICDDEESNLSLKTFQYLNKIKNLEQKTAIRLLLKCLAKDADNTIIGNMQV
jgi:transcriptional regulator with XRE-family HTH domain